MLHLDSGLRVGLKQQYSNLRGYSAMISQLCQYCLLHGQHSRHDLVHHFLVPRFAPLRIDRVQASDVVPRDPEEIAHLHMCLLQVLLRSCNLQRSDAGQ